MKRLMTKPQTLALRWMFAALCIVFATSFTASNLQAQPPGGPNSADKKIVKDFDDDGDGVLNREERDKARAFLKKEAEENASGRRGMGRRGGRFGSSRPTGKPGPKVSTSDVKFYPDAELYDPKVLRTFFLEFEHDDWEKELAAFKPTDVEVPATLTVDGKVYPNVGVSFRGASSFFMIPEGGKRSLNLSMDFIDDKQKLYGYKSLNLLNGSGDASMMSSYLYSSISSQKIATTKVNYVKVVINGRSWGVYVNSQQFNKDFLEENFDTRKGNRWKVSGSPRGDAGLRYIGDNVEDYKAKYEIKSKDKDQAWTDLIHLCKVLNETPSDQLIEKLDPILDLDGALWFLAVDVATINSDGYWTRASDYSIYQDPDGKFHVLPHDMNEAFRPQRGGRGGGRTGGRRGGGFGGPPPQGGPPQGGPPREGRRPREGGPPSERGGFGGPPPQERGAPPREGRPRDGGPPQERGGQPRQGRNQATASGGYELDPLVGIDQDRFPLRSKLLANPTLRTRYLQYLRIIARDHLAWQKMRPLVKDARQLIAKEVKADTRKLMTDESFMNATDLSRSAKPGSLREFSEKRSQYLLNHKAIKNLPRELVELPSDSKQNKKKKKK